MAVAPTAAPRSTWISNALFFEFPGLPEPGSRFIIRHAPAARPPDRQHPDDLFRRGGFPLRSAVLTGGSPRCPRLVETRRSLPVASPDKDLSRWWGRFNDPVLDRLISDSCATDPDLASARARVREARARRDATAASLLPSVGASLSTSNRRTRTGADQAGTVSSSSYSAGLDASSGTATCSENNAAP